jgi:hypothetical protein
MLWLLASRQASDKRGADGASGNWGEKGMPCGALLQIGSRACDRKRIAAFLSSCLYDIWDVPLGPIWFGKAETTP